jgi:hypothetical protein
MVLSSESITVAVMAGTVGCGSISATLIANIVGAEDMEVGEGIMGAAAIAMIVIMTGIGIMIEITTKIMTEITIKIMTATTNGITTAIETPIPW